MLFLFIGFYLVFEYAKSFHIENYTDFDCLLGCKIIKLHEIHDRFRHSACSRLNKTATGQRPLLYYCDNKGPDDYFRKFEAGIQGYYVYAINEHPNLAYEGVVFFVIDDNSTLTYRTETKLIDAGYPFLSHAHIVDHTHKNQPKPYIFQPDYHFIQYRGFRDILTSIEKKWILFYKRKQVVFWRGASSSGYESESPPVHDCNDILRVKLCKKAESHKWLDVQISSKIGRCLFSNMSVGSRIEEVKWIANRGLIDIDGNANAWGLYWRLASGSVVFKVESDFTNAYIDRLIPWVHYIPISRNLSDLVERTKMIANDKHYKKLSQIAENSKKLMKQFTFESELNRVVHELNEFYKRKMSYSNITHLF
jgi:hypothetical protein